MTLAARPIRHGLYTARPAISMGRLDLTGPCVVPTKGEEGICAAVFFFCTINLFFVSFPSGFRGPAHEPHIPTTHTIPHQRLPSRLVSPHVLLPLRRPQQQQPQQRQHLLLQHLQPASAIPAAATPPAIGLSSEKSNDSASDRLAGAPPVTAAVLIPGSTTTHTKVNVAATFGQKMSPVWANFRKF